MGRKINPIGFRLGVSRKWNSQWFAEKRYTEFVKEDLFIQLLFKNFFEQRKKRAILSTLIIQRTFLETQLFIWVYQQKKEKKKKKKFQRRKNQKGKDQKQEDQKIRLITKDELFLLFFYLKRLNEGHIRIYIKKVNVLRLIVKGVRKKLSRFKSRKYFKESLIVIEGALFTRSATVLSRFISRQLERDVKGQRDFFRFLKEAFFYYKESRALRLKGYRIQFKGKFNKKRRSQKAVIKEGEMAQNSLCSLIDYAYSPAHTIQGVCGVKVWLNFVPPKNLKEKNA